MGKMNGSTPWSPSPTLFETKCHPLVESMSREVNNYFLEHWNFQNEKVRQKFLIAEFPRVTCLYFPEARDDRIHLACQLLAILFLIDDLLEDMSFEEGSQYNENLMPLCRGTTLPDRSIPMEYMMYDLWQSMRTCDQDLANDILEPVFQFMKAQTCKERLSIKELGRYLEYRQHDVGKALLSALMCFSMNIHLSADDHASLQDLEANCSKHITAVNDIYSFEKELHAAQSGHHEGSALCSSVQVVSMEAGLGIEAAKRVLWAMCREWEICHEELVKKRERQTLGCSDELCAYMKGLEYQMSGNEQWSRTTARYRSAAA